MTEDTNESARRQVAAAQQDLDDVLAAGADASAARERLALAREELARVEAATRQSAAQVQAQRQAALRQEIQAAASAFVDRVTAEVAGYLEFADRPAVASPEYKLILLLEAQQRLNDAVAASGPRKTASPTWSSAGLRSKPSAAASSRAAPRATNGPTPGSASNCCARTWRDCSTSSSARPRRSRSSPTNRAMPSASGHPNCKRSSTLPTPTRWLASRKCWRSG